MLSHRIAACRVACLRLSPSCKFLWSLVATTLLICCAAASVRAQGGPVYPGIIPANPISDLPLVASSGWPNYKDSYGVGGTWQLPFKPVRDCNSFRLAYANSTVFETTPVKQRLYLRVALFVVRPNQPTVVRQVTFHHGQSELVLDPETMALSDAIPEYWKGSENGLAYIRTYARVETADAPLPLRSDWQLLTGYPIRPVTSASNAPDLTLAPANEPQFANATPHVGGLGPVAIFGDADPTLPSVAILGSSSVADGYTYPVIALLKARIPFVLLATTGGTAVDYNKSKLRPQVDAACSHAFVQYGRNDIGYSYLGIPPADLVLARVETNLSNLWKRLKLQGAWVSQTTITTRTTGKNYADPEPQTPSTAEVPLRLPLNDWIREQPAALDSPLDAVYEMADTAEFFFGGQRTNKWTYLTASGRRQAITSDGLHPNTAGNAYFAQKIQGSDFVYQPGDFVPPTPADAVIPAEGTRLILRFNEAKSAPLMVPVKLTGFSVTVNNAPRAVARAVASGPKELTVYVGGAAMTKNDVVTIDYLPDGARPLTDSAAFRNAVQGFSDFPADNKSQIGAPPIANAPQMNLNSVEMALIGNQALATVRLKNDGTAEALLANLRSAKLNGFATTTSLPVVLGTISPGASVAVTLSWPAPASGAKVVLKLSGDHAAGTFSSSLRVTIP